MDVPMFVIQGQNDPTGTGSTEAEQIVAALREQGSPVWYNERTSTKATVSVARKTAIFTTKRCVLFLETFLLSDN